MSTQILVAGIGNVFHGDDAFGVEVAKELLQREWPEAVEIGEFGTRSYDLAYALLNGYEAVVLVDAIQRDESPGTVVLLEPDLSNLDARDGDVVNAHSMTPVRVLQLAQTLDGNLPEMPLYLVGCEPATLEPEHGRLGLSDPVQAAVPTAIEMIRSLVQDILREKQEGAPTFTEKATD